MDWLWWVIGAVGFIVVLILAASYICFLYVFYSPKRKKLGPDEYEIPRGRIFEPYRDEMVGWVKQTREMQSEDIYLTSFDGLKLHAKYFEYQKGAPLEIQFHGYRGYAERDLSGGVIRCFALGRNILTVDQRACGESEGNVISFGINERRDCLKWVDYAVERFGNDVKIMLTGISMGAATVVLASGEELPENVVSILADCGYSSAKDILFKVMGDMKLPAKLLYPFIKLGARIFGRFGLEETSPAQAVKNAKIPMIFIHGDNDKFVPFEMSTVLYNACPNPNKRLVAIKGAGHGLAFPVDKEGYLNALRENEKDWL